MVQKFWAIELEAGKVYTQTLPYDLQVSQAALGMKVNNKDRNIVQCVIEGKTFCLGSLRLGAIEQFPLQLVFDEGIEVSFMVLGSSSVHLMGNYLVPEFGIDDSISDLEEEEMEITNPKRKRASADQLQIEGTKILLAEPDGEDDSDDESYIDEDPADEEDGVDELDLDDEEDDEEDGEDGKEDRKEVGENQINAVEDKTLEVVKEPTKSTIKPKREKPKLNFESPVSNSTEKKRKSGNTEESSAKKQKPQEGSAVTPISTPSKAQRVKVNQTPKQNEKQDSKSPQPIDVTKLPNGLIIEEMVTGDGPPATLGHLVGVKYIGKLKNGAVFDKSGKKPFSFRLGIGNVIKGWDIGVKGMKEGGKRRLTIPPSLGYGKRGSPPVIPPNATLEFEVELVQARS